jgi:hypothetical protein
MASGLGIQLQKDDTLPPSEAERLARYPNGLNHPYANEICATADSTGEHAIRHSNHLCAGLAGNACNRLLEERKLWAYGVQTSASTSTTVS